MIFWINLQILKLQRRFLISLRKNHGYIEFRKTWVPSVKRNELKAKNAVKTMPDLKDSNTKT